VTDFTDAAPDPLDALLAPPPPADAGPLRRRVGDRTARLVRGRRRRRLAVLAVACAAVLAAIVAWARTTAPPAADPHPVPSLVSLDPPEAPARPAPAPSAAAEEWRAFDSADGRAERYRRAGDRYLAEESDPASALRCYGAALDTGGPAALEVSSDDGWLLMLVKDARQKEKTHAKSGS